MQSTNRFVRFGSTTFRLHAVGCICAAVLIAPIVGCASWEPEVVFTENFRATYKKVASCKKSAHPQADYIETWMSPAGKATWDAMAVQLANQDTSTVVFPEDTVFVKAQFEDSACEDLVNFTVMKKLKEGTATKYGDWKWQFVGDDGACFNCDAATDCSGCHSGCKPAPFMCTNPQPPS